MACLYTRSKQKLDFKLKEIDKSLCSSYSIYENFTFLGDHSTEPTKSVIRDF